MSGSSLDGLDVAACAFDYREGELRSWRILAADTYPFSDAWRQRLRMAPLMTARDLAGLHAGFGRYLGELTQFFLVENAIAPQLIASHGHTVFHSPDEGFTTQVGDGAALAAVTGLPVACDFRSADLALGGQGAPLAPIADQLLFPGYDAYLNLGGIANLSCRIGRRWVAFDVTGANQVLDALAVEAGHAYDAEGQLAKRGRMIPELLTLLDQDEYFARVYPKSLGNDWVQRVLVRPSLRFAGPVPDRLHTAVIHIARQIARSLAAVRQREGGPEEPVRLLATGGGAHNRFLMETIREECEKICSLVITIPESETIAYKEAALIALMGVLRVYGAPNCLAGVTGAQLDSCGGALYAGWKMMNGAVKPWSGKP